MDIGPRAESVVKTGQATWDESLLLFLERSGYAEETYRPFSYSPVPDDSGGTGGMLCVVTEDTERVIGERRLAILRELGADLTGIKSEQQLFDAIPRHFSAYEKDLPFSLLYIFAADGRQARLAAAHGTGADNPIAPSTIDAESNEGVWPAQRIRAEALPIVIEDLSTRVQEIPPGPWPTPPHRAMIAADRLNKEMRSPRVSWYRHRRSYRPFRDRLSRLLQFSPVDPAFFRASP